MSSNHHDQLAAVLTFAFLIFMLFFGWRFHPIEEVTSAEFDGYSTYAEKILAGEIPQDPFRPLLYPILAAAAGIIAGDTFVGARTVSIIFATLLALSAYLLGRMCFGSSVGLVALLAMTLNHNVIRYGVHAATDMTFAALASFTVVLAVLSTDDTRWRVIFLLAFTFAMAFFTRYTAAALIPVALVAILLQPRRSPLRLGLAWLVFGTASVFFLVPHFILTERAFGSPFHNENWRNLAFKLYGEWDWKYLKNNPFHDFASVVLHSPLVFLKAFVRELGAFGYRTMINLGGYAIAGAVFAAGALAGGYVATQRPNRRVVTFLIYIVSYVIMVCMFFYTSPRFMLPILPMCYVLCAHFLLSNAFPGYAHMRGRRMPRSVLAVAVFLLLGLAATLREIPVFVSLHPIEEARVAEELERRHGSDLTVLGTSPFLDRLVGYRYRQILRISSGEPEEVDAYYIELKRLIEHEDADFVIVGRLTGSNVPPGLVTAKVYPAFLTPVTSSPDVVVYSVVR